MVVFLASTQYMSRTAVKIYELEPAGVRDIGRSRVSRMRRMKNGLHSALTGFLVALIIYAPLSFYLSRSLHRHIPDSGGSGRTRA